MGGSYGTPKPEKTAEMLRAYAQYLPDILRATNAETGGTAQANLDATRATEPGYQQLNTDLTREYAPQLADINSDVQRRTALAGAETNVQQLEGPGRRAAMAADATARAANPNYYKVQDEASKKAAELLGSFSMSGLSPGEAASVERSTNQTNTGTGNLGLANPNNVISNAMNFGQAFSDKQKRLGDALGAATSTATSAQNTGFNPVNIALGQPNVSGATQFAQSNTAPAASQGTLQFGQGLLSGQFGTQGASIGAAASRANANNVLGNIPSYS